MKRRKGPTPRRRMLVKVCCDGCGGVFDRPTKAAPPPVFPMRPKPLLSPSRFEEPSDWVATCLRCPSETGVYVSVTA